MDPYPTRLARITEPEWRDVRERLSDLESFREEVGQLITETTEAKKAAAQAADCSLQVALEMVEFKQTLRSLEEFRDNSAIIEIGVLRGKVKQGDALRNKLLYGLLMLLGAAVVKDAFGILTHR